MLPLNAELINHEKLVSLYLKKMNIDFSKREPYDNMTKELLEDTIREIWDVKGELNWKSLLPAKKITDVPLEKEEQKAFIKWLKEHKIAHFATGLGFQMLSAAQVNSLKSLGHYSGIPDMVVLLGKSKIAFVEMKRQKGGVVSELQKKWLEYLNNNGYPARVCNGANEAIEFIESLESEGKNEI